ncbi:urea ABC transporter permease subunit UrtB [Propylenella binzhouense]|uniref:Urea ABC transporter permease subunit UrtB n=1 Tax=Propylenella binzhouense TaxID=2555902 RepID=A0A964WV88_9HYPH|nr:urea ABC transporter permease subunit UrtB [Propylenella binzhouense]MYZ49804.1 urea ABC transporter permease subunit UrtB [Propylenella binzhouense]
MTSFLRMIVILLALCTAAAPGAHAEADPGALLAGLGAGDYDATEAAIARIVATGDARFAPALAALGSGDLYTRKSDGRVVIGRKAGGRELALIDPLSGDALGEAASRELEKIRVNNRIRRAVRSAIGVLTLMSPNRAVRLAAANSIFASPDPESLEALDAALAAEKDPQVQAAMERARAASILASDRPEAEKVAAIETVAARGGRDALSILTPLANSENEAVKSAAAAGIARVESVLAMWDAAQNVWYGISLGSVLLLAAIGLAITFGVMGVINMAHGEMVMLGAYTTFVVQEIIRTSAPWLFDWSLVIALPLAFLVAGAAGFVIERGIIRWLYGRPLETLLATWGISLILQQAVRSLFGPTNREVGNPSWMSGAFELGGLTITYNRLWIVVFTLAVFALLLFVTRFTTFGLQMRAVTQNRRMAASMGIRTPWIDAFTFALGSGIAGIAGVALSQVGNVSPSLGQGYIIDSFMVVVFGGVGNLWGTLVGALSLGVLNKFLEPYAGAVLGKILVLVLIILFIQKRPRGLFAQRGRAVES